MWLLCLSTKFVYKSDGKKGRKGTKINLSWTFMFIVKGEKCTNKGLKNVLNINEQAYQRAQECRNKRRTITKIYY